MDLIIRNSRLLGEANLYDIGLSEDRITMVGHSTSDHTGAKFIDAQGMLVLPSFVEPHIHLDKVLLAEQLEESNSIAQAREKVKEAKRGFTVQNVTSRVERVLPWAVQAGVSSIRTHIDVDSIVRLVSIEALLALRKKYEKTIDIQIVAFPQEGLIKDSGAIDLMEKALAMGADCVGGLPEAEKSLEDSQKHIDIVTQMAKEKGKDIDVHCDVLPSSRSIEYYLTKVESQGLSGRATADHLISLSYYPEHEALQIIDYIKRAGVNVISNPCTTIVSGASPSPPLGRGVTRIKEMLHAGVKLAFGTDNIEDPYNPFGDFDPLSNSWLFSYLGQLNSSSDLQSVLMMPTFVSASILRLERYGIRPGDRANLNILNADTEREAVRTHVKPRYVIRNGSLIAENRIDHIRD